ncbi:unnamed protein product [Sphenostylis stenocarpa]|uniref:Uncharacterized protein n=1 Tax=Sphenostylis stenocarpa TaxID=92480 RepID=A0AA86T4H0_9FABA|nr:unnamed protein product [Sphenostylis stenocarpa]
MVRRTALIIAVSWLLLVAFTVVSANVDNTKGHPPTSKHMVYYPQGAAGSYGSQSSNVGKYVVEMDVALKLKHHKVEAKLL